jgi:hypothetical protein
MKEETKKKREREKIVSCFSDEELIAEWNEIQRKNRWEIPVTSELRKRGLYERAILEGDDSELRKFYLRRMR